MPVLHEPNKTYETKFKILSPDSTRERLLKPSAAMKYFQEISDVHSALAGNDYYTLRDRGVAFICAKTSLNFLRTPAWGDEVLCRTWHRQMKGSQWIRDCVMLNDGGEVLVESTTSWVLLDLEARRVCRPNRAPGTGVLTAPELALQNDRLGKINLPEDMPVVGARQVYYSNIDYVGHLNNCVYADLVCDAMVGGMDGRALTRLDISFLQEASQGDTLEIRALERDGLCYITASHSRGKCFDAVAAAAPVSR